MGDIQPPDGTYTEQLTQPGGWPGASESNLEAALAQYRSELKDLNRELTDWRGRHTQIFGSWGGDAAGKAQGTHAGNVEDLQQLITAYNKKIDWTRRQIDNVRSAKQTVVANTETANTKLDQLDTQIQTLNQQDQTLREQIQADAQRGVPGMAVMQSHLAQLAGVREQLSSAAAEKRSTLTGGLAQNVSEVSTAAAAVTVDGQDASGGQAARPSGQSGQDTTGSQSAVAPKRSADTVGPQAASGGRPDQDTAGLQSQSGARPTNTGTPTTSGAGDLPDTKLSTIPDQTDLLKSRTTPEAPPVIGLPQSVSGLSSTAPTQSGSAASAPDGSAASSAPASGSRTMSSAPSSGGGGASGGSGGPGAGPVGGGAPSGAPTHLAGLTAPEAVAPGAAGLPAGGGGSGPAPIGLGGAAASSQSPLASAPIAGAPPSSGGPTLSGVGGVAGPGTGPTSGVSGAAMGQHGQGEKGKEKRRTGRLSPDEEFYVEEREWTEGIIKNQGSRDRKIGS